MTNAEKYTELWRELGRKYDYHQGRSCPRDPGMTGYHNCKFDDVRLCREFVREGSCVSLFFAQRERFLTPLGIEIADTEKCYRYWEAVAFAKMRHEIGKISDQELLDFENTIVKIANLSKQMEINREAREEEKRKMDDVLRHL